VLTKFGVNNTRIERSTRTVKSAPYKKIVTCKKCGCKCEKSCPSEKECTVSVLECPKCGAPVK